MSNYQDHLDCTGKQILHAAADQDSPAYLQRSMVFPLPEFGIFFQVQHAQLFPLYQNAHPGRYLLPRFPMVIPVEELVEGIQYFASQAAQKVFWFLDKSGPTQSIEIQSAYPEDSQLLE